MSEPQIPPAPKERARCPGCGRFGKWAYSPWFAEWYIQAACWQYDPGEYEHPGTAGWYCERKDEYA